MLERVDVCDVGALVKLVEYRRAVHLQNAFLWRTTQQGQVYWEKRERNHTAMLPEDWDFCVDLLRFRKPEFPIPVWYTGKGVVEPEEDIYL